MKTKFKIATIFICVCISALACAFAFSACNADDDSKNTEPAPIAGLFELKDIPLYYENLFITKYDYQFYKNGTVKTTIYASTTSGGYSDIRTNYGTYTWNEGDELIYVRWSGSSKIIDLKYTGEYITNGIMYNYFAGANDSGEVAGKLALASYSVRTYAKYYLSNPGGEIYGEKDQYIKKGESATSVKAVAAEGFEFTGWSDGKTEAERRDLNVTDNVIVSANFKQVDEIYKLNYEASYGGKIEGNDYQEVAEGRNAATVKAVSLSDSYKFVKWSDGVTTAERTDLNVTENMDVNAEFGLVQRFTYRAEEYGSIQGETVQFIPTGASGTAVTAVPDEGYKFSNWSDGLRTATRCEEDTTVTAETEFIAFFVRDTSYTPDTPDTPSKFEVGDGTEENPYLISTVNQLANVANYPSANFKLQNDIVLKTVANGQFNFKPLFSDDNPFNGTFDGNGHKIVNLTLYNTATFYTGLFACVGESGLIKNLTLDNVNISGANYIGGIAALSYGEIYNCTVSGKLAYLPVNNMILVMGGVAGRIDGNFYECKADIEISVAGFSSSCYIGGIVGRADGSFDNNTAIKCSSTGNITIENSDRSLNPCVGGLMGYGLYGFENCFNAINIKCKGEVSVGGLIGATQGGYVNYINDCYNSGDISVEGGCAIGGLSGGSASIRNSYNVGNIKVVGDNNVCVGGLVGCSALSIINSYNSGNIEIKNSDFVSVGGLVGDAGGYGSGNVYCSYNTGNIIVTTADANCYVGGLVGRGGGYEEIINRSYFAGKINVECDKSCFIGGIIAYSNVKLSNCHWLTDENDVLLYAVGNNQSLGIPSSMGSTKHNNISDFYNLAEVLNEGLEEPIWENTADGLPVLLLKNEEI